MAGKSFFIDTSRCTACRGCQVADKEWNQLKGMKTCPAWKPSEPGRSFRFYLEISQVQRSGSG